MKKVNSESYQNTLFRLYKKMRSGTEDSLAFNQELTWLEGIYRRVSALPTPQREFEFVHALLRSGETKLKEVA